MATIEQRTSQDGKSVYRVKMAALSHAFTIHQTKNGSHRAVPLTGPALTLMQQHAKIRRRNTQLVFPDATGTRPLRTRDCT